jgi:hypothetical protein
VFSKTEYWDQLPSLSSESKTRRRHGAFFAPGLPYACFRRDTLFCLYSKVSYPGHARPRAMAAYTVREECDERTGEYRENEAGEGRDPLQEALQRHTPRASSVAFLLRRQPRSTPLAIDLSRHPQAQSLDVRPHDLETYDELARIHRNNNDSEQ